MAREILVTAQSPNSPFPIRVQLFEIRDWDFGNEGKQNFILVLLQANFTYLKVLTSVLSDNSMKEILLLLFPELLAQPGRACLLCFTPEFNKVLVSLANRCLGDSLCQIKGLSAIG